MRGEVVKRPRNQAAQPTEVKYVAFGGGLNLIDSHTTMPEGMLTECLNYEQVFGRQGYSRINGYERYDGRLEPHSATYAIQNFDGGTAAINVGSVVTGPSASAVVLFVEITSGAWGTSDAAGRLIIYNLTGAWADNENIQVSGATKAIANGATANGSVAEANNQTYKTAAVEARRASISAIPGSGSVRGIGVANNVVYAVRNVADGTSSTLYKATSSGWTEVRTGLYPSGDYRMIPANFTGSTASIYLFGCDGKNNPFRYDGTRFLFVGAYSTASSTTSMTPATGAKTFTITEAARDFITGQYILVWSEANPAEQMIGTVTSYTSGTNTLIINVTTAAGASARTDWRFSHNPVGQVFGSQAASGTAVAIGTGSKSFNILDGSRSWVVGDELKLWSAADASKSMTGLVTAYSGTSLTVNVTSVTGSGTPLDWMISKSNFSDKPYDLVAHKDHLFLAYPYGQVQTSNLGDPMTYTSTATLFGLGAEVMGMVSIKGGVLAIYCNGKLELLEGASKATWAKQINSVSTGAVFKSVQELAQSVFALDMRGLSSLQATLNYGSFEISIMSRHVKPYLDLLLESIVGSRIVKTKNQYRLYTAGGEMVTFTLLTPNAQITADDISVTRCFYDRLISTIGYGEISGEEYLFFGDSNGYVYREDVGTSFDGGNISSVLRMPFYSFKAPSNKKRFRKLVIEIDASQQTTLYYRQLFDYADGFYQPSLIGNTIAYGGGGQWNTSDWDTFYWSLPVQTQAEANIGGVGKNMGLLMWHESSIDDPFNLQGILIHYSNLGLSR